MKPRASRGRPYWVRGVAVLALLAFLGSACGDDHTTNGDLLAGTMWELTSVRDGGVLGSPNPTTIATLVFTDGTASGSTGCNLFRSAYTVDGDALLFGELALTGSACDPELVGLDDTMVRALEAVVRFAVSDDQLELFDAGGAMQMQFRPADQLPLVGIAWQIVWYSEGTSPLDGTEISIAFSADGTLTGSTGCNSYSADYRADGDRLIVGAIAQTEMACGEPDGVMQQEAEYLEVVRKTSSFATTLTGLELSGADGTPIAEYRFAGRIRDLGSG